MSKAGPQRRAVFLDRDGTLNEEVDYLSSPDDFRLLPGVGDALKSLSDAGYALIVVTNQSGIARGILSEATLDQIHARMAADLAEFDVKIDWIGYCPHHPEIGEGYFKADCSCRKPEPGMLIEGAARMNVDLATSWCVGDSLRDLDAASIVNAYPILVRTGKGKDQEAKARELSRSIDVVDGMAEAAAMILGSAQHAAAAARG